MTYNTIIGSQDTLYENFKDHSHVTYKFSELIIFKSYSFIKYGWALCISKFPDRIILDMYRNTPKHPHFDTKQFLFSELKLITVPDFFPFYIILTNDFISIGISNNA